MKEIEYALKNEIKVAGIASFDCLVFSLRTGIPYKECKGNCKICQEESLQWVNSEHCE